MAYNTRGRIKERFEGIHKNFEWIKVHCAECLKLIADKNPSMSEGVKSLGEGAKMLDDIAQDIYSKV
ncbi:unnamed protein product [marine sediment metagenome]|uniref:Uncharacterized protein n=1 Tax=marine sediment metagenome TaxID=412755 RepID=X1R859_9ZZZZ